MSELRRHMMMQQGGGDEIIIDARGGDPNAVAIMEVMSYNKSNSYGDYWCANPLYMTKSEAENVTDFYIFDCKRFKNNTNITDAYFVKYFINAWGTGNIQGFWSFDGCTNLRNIELPDDATIFPCCRNSRVTNVIATKGVMSFANFALYNLPSRCDVVLLCEQVPDFNNYWNPSFGNNVYFSCPQSMYDAYAANSKWSMLMSRFTTF